MPTGSRLLCAVCLAIVGFVVSGLIIPLFPERTNFGNFTNINMALGALCGWIVMGPRTGHGVSSGITNGITGVAALVFWALFVQGCYEMVRLAMANRYKGPFEAIVAVFEIAIVYSLIIFTPTVLGTLLVGAVLSGLAGEVAARRWR